jgi:hypothetical protein
MSSVGIDIGTNMIVAGRLDEGGNPVFKMQRDAFYRIIPKSEVNKNSIRMSLEKQGSNFIVDGEDFVVVGEDALSTAIERNDVAKRPLRKGVVSPKEKDSLPMLKLLIEHLIGKGNGSSDMAIYSVPAKPIDSHFDIVYHTEMMNLYLGQMGYKAQPINEAFAVALSELLDEGLTGVAISFGAGMSNITIIHQGDPLIEFSLTRGGDYIDQAVGTALDISPSLVQLEKESGIDLFNPKDKISEAVSVYYGALINYIFKNIAFELDRRKKELPVFKDPVPVIVSGGLTLAEGFVSKVEMALSNINFPIKISKVKRAKDPMKAVANGCLLAAQL